MTAVDHDYYTGVYGGDLTEADFLRLSVPGMAYLEDVTMGRVDEELPEAVDTRARLALCAVLDAMAVNERRGDLAAESNDGLSLTYRTGEAPGGRVYQAAAMYLAGCGLLFRGVEP